MPISDFHVTLEATDPSRETPKLDSINYGRDDNGEECPALSIATGGSEGAGRVKRRCSLTLVCVCVCVSVCLCVFVQGLEGLGLGPVESRMKGPSFDQLVSWRRAKNALLGFAGGRADAAPFVRSGKWDVPPGSAVPSAHTWGQGVSRSSSSVGRKMTREFPVVFFGLRNLLGGVGVDGGVGGGQTGIELPVKVERLLLPLAACY